MSLRKIVFILFFVCAVFGGQCFGGGTVNINIDRSSSSCTLAFGANLNVGRSYAQSATDLHIKFDSKKETMITNTGHCYGCDTTPHKCYSCRTRTEIPYNEVLQTLYGKAYVCTDYSGVTDKWDETSTRWCADTETREWLNGAKYCLRDSQGSTVGCRVYGDEKNLVYNDVRSGGCLHATVPVKSCDGKAHGTTEQGVQCKNIQNSKKCSRKCNDGTWNYTLTDCVQYYHVNGNKCVKDTKYPDGLCTSDDLAKVKRAGHAIAGKYDKNLQCHATECKSGSWLVYKDGQSLGWCATDADCENNYKLKLTGGHAIIGSGDKVECVQSAGECPEGEKPEHAKDAELQWDESTRAAKCVAKSCVEPEKYELKNGVCVEKEQKEDENQSNKPDDNNEVKAGAQEQVDENVSECSDEEKKTINEDIRGKMVAGSGDNVEKYTVKEGDEDLCFVYVCKSGFKVKSGQCVADENAQPASPDGDAAQSSGASSEDECKQGGGELKDGSCDCGDKVWNNETKKCEDKTPVAGGTEVTEEEKPEEVKKPHSEEELEELQGKVDAAKEKEQSFANRMLSGATMAATGAGGQMLASALAEQNADADAERDMAAYLATFRCNWGSNSVQGGEQNVALAGGNELISLYQEYVALANDLKIRKSALDMTAGIESEPILDGATSGLYDDVGTGITSGAYASLARALMDPSGVDAQKWAAQKEQTQKQLKTGAITAGVGAVVGLAGNVLINHVNYNKKKRKDDPAVKAKYKEVTDKIEQLEREINATPVSTANSGENCEKYEVTGTWPDCDCGDKNKTFSSEKKACGDTSSNSTETPAESKCNLTGKHKSDTCECVDNATRVDNNECVCKLGYEDPENKNVCTPVSKEEEKAEKEAETKTVVVETHLRSDILFKTGSAELTQTAIDYIFRFTNLIERYPNLLNKESFKKDENGNAKATIIIYGHTDRVPFKAGSNMTNKKLSEQRAEAIKQQLIKQSSLFKEIANDIYVFGKGADECTEQYHPKANDPQCRKVNIEISVSSDDAEGLGNLQSAFQGFFLGSDQATGTGARFGQK